MERKIRVLRIINRFNIGGPTYNATFLTAFLGDNFETKLVGGLPDVGESDSLYIPENYGVQPHLIKEMVRLPNLKSDQAAYKKLKEIIREYQPDIVHTHASKAGALGRRAARACGVPIVVHTFHGHVFHSYFGKFKTRLFKLIERRMAKRSDAIIAISNIQKHELTVVHGICRPDKVHVIPLGFDLQPFHDKRLSERARIREKYTINENEIAIGIIGRLAPIKNHDMFFAAMEQVLASTRQKIKIFVVGDGSERAHVEERAAQINQKYGAVVCLTSWITDIGAFNAGMDIICLTSRNEGTPVSLIEAQAGGVPVVTTDVGGVRDVVVEGETGYIVDPNDVKQFAQRVLFLIENEKKRTEMSQNGWNFVQEKFHYSTLVKNVRQLYLDLLEQKKR
ncbi:MAG: hypothetical protein A3D92_19535 [Bacteroidetes bacterium RIFCSPHIGHO2_02_FULL_44_7]|nr:MAG: hypothetical protein A3D92_19535 [Bacteroidetes bacterium RIFCSPHIGHO2_02_FULL_44_7]